MSENPDLARNLLEDLLRGLAKSRKGNQAIVAVDAPNQSFRWIGSVGETEAGDPVVENTPFFIASIDKLYNATIAMMLAESGKLDLDQSIRGYLPNTITHGLHQYGGRDRTAEITPRHLLTHTSGLADWFEDYPKGGSSLAEIVFAQGDRMLSIDELAGHVRERLKAHFPPQDLPGKRPKIRYSDTNFILMAEIIEAVTGLPLHEVHQRMLYEPFGLAQTCFFKQSQPLLLTSAPMILRVNGEPLHIPLLIQSVKGIYSTVADMMKFMRRLMKNEVFASPETLTAMMSPWRRFGFPMDRAALRSPSWPIEYAIGMMRFRVPRLFSPIAPIPAVLGHTGSTGCWLFYCPELDVAIAGSMEDAAAGAVPFRMAPDILKILIKSGWKASGSKGFRV
ncbi:serine hydrolase domain-containing protein [Desulfobulbus alkaliphilus]|uniref:serine hydrolase domain-containing protein n=1 Tax=Desulfobulbus alkaliphilus TaxID=869814 RepID=UPI0019663692|nr:serine hydrolase domain-containing protein [Desulfobulbus alkaliphilus]MBM9537543.1 beta-lactamase family protein [Desulfobulbus alkaliphilus]